MTRRPPRHHELPDGRPQDGRHYVFVNPAPRARWLVVDHDHFREIYDASDPYPVRISTTDGIDRDTSSLTVRVRSYDADGKEVGDETLHAVVAG